MTSSSRRAELEALVARLGLRWNDAAGPLLEEAMLHRSYAVENNLARDNERLELLGDAVVGLMATEVLMERHPAWDEGALSQARAAVVSRRVLGELGEGLGLGALLLLGVGENQRGGRTRPSILGCALEAVCGALYLAYPYSELRPALRATIVEPAVALAERLDLVDYKSRLQEWCQARALPLPEYRVVGEHGPEHRKQFAVECLISGVVTGRGEGPRIQLAQHAAAREALEARTGLGGALPARQPRVHGLPPQREHAEDAHLPAAATGVVAL
jgi:ribonuclease-3